MSERKEWPIKESDYSVDDTSITTAPKDGGPIATSVDGLLAMPHDLYRRPRAGPNYAVNHEIYYGFKFEGKVQDNKHLMHGAVKAVTVSNKILTVVIGSDWYDNIDAWVGRDVVLSNGECITSAGLDGREVL